MSVSCAVCQQTQTVPALHLGSLAATEVKIIPPECRRFGVYVDWSGYRDGEELQPVWNQMISAWQNWHRWIGVEGYPTRVRSAAQCLVQFLPAEKLGGALATATSSDGTCRQRTISLNSEYFWPDQLLTTRKVMEHEFGHFFGLSHYAGSEPSIMKSLVYDGIQPIDIQNALNLGYPAREILPPKKKVLTNEQLTDFVLKLRDILNSIGADL